MPAAWRDRPIGIKDVAARARVSLKTVTNVVHDRPNVAPQTRKRVQEAIDALGYRPSMAARALASGRSRTIALAVPRIDNPYIGALAHVIQAAAVERGYRVMIDETRGSAEAELEGISGYPGSGVEAVVFEPYVRDRAWLTGSASKIPTVLLSDWVPDSHADTVAIDNERSARDLVDLLVDRGCRHLVLVGSQPHTPTSVGELRVQAARRRASELGLPTPTVIPLRDYSDNAGRMIAARYRRQFDEADAAMCTSDLIAVGLIKQLTTDGVAIPDGLMVVGWDNIPAGAIVEPSLTTVEPDWQFLASAVVDAAIGRIEGPEAPARRLMVPHRVVPRKSIRRASGRPSPAHPREEPNRQGTDPVDQPRISRRERRGLIEALTAWRIASYPSREIAKQLGFSGVGGLIEATTSLAEMIDQQLPLTREEWSLVRNAAAQMLQDRSSTTVVVDDPVGPFPSEDVISGLSALSGYAEAFDPPADTSVAL